MEIGFWMQGFKNKNINGIFMNNFLKFLQMVFCHDSASSTNTHTVKYLL